MNENSGKKKKKARRSKKCNKGKKNETGVSTVDLLAAMPSSVALEALLRSGAGAHGDRRRKRRKGRQAWKLDMSIYSGE